MKTIPVLSILIIILTGFLSERTQGQKIFSCENKYDADFIVFVTENKYDADLWVFKTESKYDAEGNKGLWYFTESKYDAEKKIYFTENKYDADLLIFFSESKYDAGWKNRAKMHLLF